MARRHTKVDQRLPFSFGVPGSDGIGTELQLERRSDTVARQKSVIDRVLTVRVEIDEPGRDDESFDVYRVARGGDARGHGGYAPPYGANRVETRFRIEHPAADEHDVDRPGALGHRVGYRECKLANRQQDERAVRHDSAFPLRVIDRSVNVADCESLSLRRQGTVSTTFAHALGSSATRHSEASQHRRLGHLTERVPHFIRAASSSRVR